MPTPYGGELVVVHGGLVPGVPLEEQDPWAVLHMRTLLIKKKKEGKKDKHKKDKKKNKNKKHHKLSIEKAASPASDHSDEGDEDDNNDDDEELLDDVHPEADLDSLLAPVHDNDNAAISMTPLESREGKPWARVWDKFQHRAVPDPARRTTVVFGHDAKAGLQVGEYSFGLDTGCVAGGKLTAMVFYEDEDEDLEGKRDAVRGGVVKVAHRFVSVPCRAGVKYDL
ncbi:hypothetical protein Micbo1qcDRAFT_158858 [Microdochium bolleyi]|uniref:Uncharacterized protein n=1 Tax=Microdochium bolleyi TaxID=196109 RepID=A0A136J9T5_9PEZI|nr:hypothetical protein Micbo1qcDRAFT_158858 [Microdochium bolleyi]